MRPNLCPRCREQALVDIGDGYYRCENCGYTGTSTFEKDLFKKGKR